MNGLYKVVFCTSVITLFFAAHVAAQVTAAPSGIPGDGIPDLYYFRDDGLTAPNGQTRDAGTLTLDTDGADFAALLVSDVEAHFFNGCILCDGGSGPCNTPSNCHFFTAGNIHGSSQWIRTHPLSGPGPIGIFDLGLGLAGLDSSYFQEVFDDQLAEDLWSFRFSTDSSGQFFSNVTIVPEPSAMLLCVAGVPWVLRRYGAAGR